MRDLQRRLVVTGHLATSAEPGRYCDATRLSVEAFQRARGLRATGFCDEDTWLALVEAGWRLGDRLLLLRAPQMRGDDVAELQQVLNRLGFDCGRPDGIFGPATTRALVDFQRNSGLVADGLCGPRTVQLLSVVRRQTGAGPGVASIRELQSLDAGSGRPTTLRVVLGQFGGLSALTRTISRSLRHRGAVVMATDEYDPHTHAAAANRFGAGVYLGFEAVPDVSSSVSYFSVQEFESVGGRQLAEGVAAALDAIDWPLGSRPSASVHGMRLPVLRETRMPAVLCSLGPVRQVVDAAGAVAAAVVDAVDCWSRD